MLEFIAELISVIAAVVTDPGRFRVAHSNAYQRMPVAFRAALGIGIFCIDAFLEKAEEA